MPDFRLVAPFEPTGDQPQAIEQLVDGLSRGLRHQTLLGVTGSGKSLPGWEPVLVGQPDADGSIQWRVRPIGDIVDEAITAAGSEMDVHGSEIVRGDGHPTFVATIDPETHESRVSPVTAFTRHAAPDRLWRVETMDGRHVTVTGDHNFVRLGPGAALELAETTALRAGDALPLPGRLEAPDR